VARAAAKVVVDSAAVMVVEEKGVGQAVEQAGVTVEEVKEVVLKGVVRVVGSTYSCTLDSAHSLAGRALHSLRGC